MAARRTGLPVLLFLAFWLVMRGPNVYADLQELRKQRNEFKQRRQDLLRPVPGGVRLPSSPDEA